MAIPRSKSYQAQSLAGIILALSLQFLSGRDKCRRANTNYNGNNAPCGINSQPFTSTARMILREAGGSGKQKKPKQE